jgi:hypothetical protein
MSVNVTISVPVEQFHRIKDPEYRKNMSAQGPVSQVLANAVVESIKRTPAPSLRVTIKSLHRTFELLLDKRDDQKVKDVLDQLEDDYGKDCQGLGLAHGGVRLDMGKNIIEVYHMHCLTHYVD